ncbi:MAG: hypothetical protein IMZ53_07010 [Thermoplasmata archaeon]|nr:hypothetical protein [Thermoplasmata archaeon]
MLDKSSCCELSFPKKLDSLAVAAESSGLLSMGRKRAGYFISSESAASGLFGCEESPVAGVAARKWDYLDVLRNHCASWAARNLL